uniref:Uncharacterized protein n=1 Tax=Coccidioides posadasii RMSCC 3488 TaxID=454284 RepID=A0A0J6FFT0_COCPO|nr:hypothetical protein CPAG_08310 [Coccidioides posadasii RMSCC 3488]
MAITTAISLERLPSTSLKSKTPAAHVRHPSIIFLRFMCCITITSSHGASNFPSNHQNRNSPLAVSRVPPESGRLCRTGKRVAARPEEPFTFRPQDEESPRLQLLLGLDTYPEDISSPLQLLQLLRQFRLQLAAELPMQAQSH